MPSASTAHKTQRVHESRHEHILLFLVHVRHDILNTRHKNMSFMACDIIMRRASWQIVSEMQHNKLQNSTSRLGEMIYTVYGE